MEGPSKSNPTVSTKFSHEEAVQFVTITPRVVLKENFSIGVKMTCRMTSGNKTVYSEFSGASSVQ